MELNEIVHNITAAIFLVENFLVFKNARNLLKNKERQRWNSNCLNRKYKDV